MHPDLKNVQFDAPYFDAYVRAPDVFSALARENLGMVKGWLCKTMECHACFYYAMTARRNYEQYVLGFEVQLEEIDYTSKTDFKHCFDTIILLYGAQPEKVISHWSCVDRQMKELGISLLPDEEKYRFNNVPEIKTQ